MSVHLVNLVESDGRFSWVCTCGAASEEPHPVRTAANLAAFMHQIAETDSTAPTTGGRDDHGSEAGERG